MESKKEIVNVEKASEDKSVQELVEKLKSSLGENFTLTINNANKEKKIDTAFLSLTFTSVSNNKNVDNDINDGNNNYIINDDDNKVTYKVSINKYGDIEFNENKIISISDSSWYEIIAGMKRYLKSKLDDEENKDIKNNNKIKTLNECLEAVKLGFAYAVISNQYKKANKDEHEIKYQGQDDGFSDKYSLVEKKSGKILYTIWLYPKNIVIYYDHDDSKGKGDSITGSVEREIDDEEPRCVDSVKRGIDDDDVQDIIENTIIPLFGINGFDVQSREVGEYDPENCQMIRYVISVKDRKRGDILYSFFIEGEGLTYGVYDGISHDKICDIKDIKNIEDKVFDNFLHNVLPLEDDSKVSESEDHLVNSHDSDEEDYSLDDDQKFRLDNSKFNIRSFLAYIDKKVGKDYDIRIIADKTNSRHRLLTFRNFNNQTWSYVRFEYYGNSFYTKDGVLLSDCCDNSEGNYNKLCDAIVHYIKTEEQKQQSDPNINDPYNLNDIEEEESTVSYSIEDGDNNCFDLYDFRDYLLQELGKDKDYNVCITKVQEHPDSYKLLNFKNLNNGVVNSIRFDCYGRSFYTNDGNDVLLAECPNNYISSYKKLFDIVINHIKSKEQQQQNNQSANNVHQINNGSNVISSNNLSSKNNIFK